MTTISQQSMFDEVKLNDTVCFYAGLNAVAFVGIFCLVPETKQCVLWPAKLHSSNSFRV